MGHHRSTEDFPGASLQKGAMRPTTATREPLALETLGFRRKSENPSGSAGCMGDMMHIYIYYCMYIYIYMYIGYIYIGYIMIYIYRIYNDIYI